MNEWLPVVSGWINEIERKFATGGAAAPAQRVQLGGLEAAAASQPLLEGYMDEESGLMQPLIEETEEQSKTKCVANMIDYLQSQLGRAPLTDLDLLFGIGTAFGGTIGGPIYWWIPYEHPIAILLEQNSGSEDAQITKRYRTAYGNFAVYDNTVMQTCIKAIIAMFRENNREIATTDEFILWRPSGSPSPPEGGMGWGT